MKLLSKSRLFLLVVLALLLALPSGVLAQEPPAPAPIIKTDGVYGVDHPQNAGDVYLFKTVQEKPGTLNTFHVTLHVEAKDAVNSNDIVLVIDTSGRMAGARIANAKAAARQFINEILVPEQTLTRIALVSFATAPSIRRNFTSYANKQSLINAVNALQPVGGTNTQGGIHTAQTLLDNSTADYKNIVLLSDGQPTYSYEIPDNTIRRNGYYIDAVGGYVTGTGYAASAFSSDRVGDGRSMYEYIERYNWRRAYYHHGNSAIAEAGFAKVAGSKIHSIALSAGAEGTPILQQISSAGSFYNTTNPAELTTIFSQIAAAISSAVNNASITDGMGVGFQLTLGDASNLDPSQGEAGYNTSTSTLSWNVGNLTKPVSDLGGGFATVDPLVKYAQLEYDVTINDNILGIPPPADGNYDVNRDATLKFTDINGAEKTSDFPVPLAKPVIVELRKEVRDNMGNLITADTSVVGRSETSDPGDRKFTFRVALRDTPTNYKDYIMNGTSSRVMADFCVDDFYTISESAITGAVQDNFADYDTTIRWQTWDNTQSSGTAIEGTTFENFKVPRDASNNPLNTTFTIVNKEKPLGVLNLTKHFDPTPGVDGDTVTAPIAGSTQEFTFHVTGPYNYVQDVKIKAGETKKLENLVYGVYTVVETAGGENFTVTYTDTYGDSANQSGTKSDGSVKLSFDNKTGGVTVLNTVKAGDVFTDFVAKKIWVNGDPNDHVAIQLNLYRDGDPVTNPPTPTVSPKDTTVAGQTTYTYTYTGLPKYRQDGGLSVYTVLENVQTQFYRVTYSDDKTQVYNTYKAPTANQVATKVWTDGENYNNGVRPTVWFQLWRSIAGGTAAAVPGAEVKELPNGTTTVTWENLPTKNDAAQDYVYTVKEVRNAGTAEAPNWVSYTPEHYTKTETGNTVTNTFRVQYQQITASKVWDVTNAAGLTPEAVDVWFHLYRKLPAGLPERMTTTAPVQLAANLAGTSYTWPEEMPITDGFGNVYDYYVVEVDASGNPWTPLNYTADTTNDLVVTNTFNAEAYRQGKLTIRKALIDNSALPGGNPSVSGVVGDDPLEFTFLVKGPYGYEEPVTLTAGTEVTLENLLYGEYTVEETVTHDYVPQYIPDGGKANVAPGQLQPPVVEVKNNHDAEDDQNVVAVRAFKQWEGSEGEKPAPLTLYRAPGVPTDTMPMLAVNAAPVIQDLGNGLYQYDWTNLPEHNPYGSTYQYTVKESTFKLVADDPASPDIFMVEGRYFAVTHETDADGIVTVTNTFMQPESATLEITASKTLSGAALKNEQFTFALSVADSDVNLNAKNDETGAVVFEPISFNKQGDYLITVREVDEKARNYIYDGTTYTILVKVTTDKNNVLQLETTYARDGQPHEGELQFTNTYEKEPSAITSSPIAARVELIGRTLKDREFEFQLRDGADNVMDTVRNGPDGRFSFGTQRFSREGTYVYTIQQVKGTEEGMFYDMEPIRVRITVREGRSGMLEVFMEFLLPTAHATDTGRVLTSGTTYTKAGVDVTSDPLLTNRVGIPPTGDNALTMPLVMMALSLMGLGLWLFSKMRRTDTV